MTLCNVLQNTYTGKVCPPPVFGDSRSPSPYGTIDGVLQPIAHLAAWTPEGRTVGDHEYRDDAAEGREMLQRFTEYMRSEGRALEQYLGRSRKPHFVGTAKLPQQAVAANVRASNGLQGIVSSRGYVSKVAQLAGNHGLSWDLANTYVLAHEQMHLLDPKLSSRSTVGAERYVEQTLLQYFSQRAMRAKGAERQNYLKLASIAKQRLVWLNKGGNNAYRQGIGCEHGEEERQQAPQQEQRSGDAAVTKAA